MADNLNSSNVSACTLFDSYRYVIVAAVSSGSAMVSALCCIFVIGLIFLFKKQIFFTQRIILYHCLVTLLLAFSTMLRLHRLGYSSESKAVHIICVLSGFTKQVTNWCLLMDYSVITFTLLMTAVFRKNVARLEGLFIILMFVVPFTFNWVPFIHDSYGKTGAWCWIRSLNYDSNCTEHELGIIFQNVLLNIPEAIFAVILIPMYTVVIVFVARQRWRLRGKESHDPTTTSLEKHLNEEVWPLLFFPIGVVLLNIFPIANHIQRIIHPQSPSYVLWILHAIFSPLQGGYVALVYTLDRNTLRRLTYKNVKMAMASQTDAIQEYPAEPGELSESMAVRSGSLHKTHYRKFNDTVIPLIVSDSDDYT